MADPSIRILVVDDEEILRVLLVDVLGLAGYEVEVASSGEDALSRFAPGRYPVVITDNNMPGIDGLGVLGEVQRRDPLTQVIIMTAYGSIDVSMRAHELGAAGYLLKPFEDIDVVVAEVQRVLSRREKQLRLR